MAIFGFWVQAPLTWAPGLKNPRISEGLKNLGIRDPVEVQTGEIFAYMSPGN